MSKPTTADPIELLCDALGYKKEGASMEWLRKNKRGFFDRLCQLVEKGILGTTLTTQTPANKIMLIGKGRKITPLLQSSGVVFGARTPDWTGITKKCPPEYKTKEAIAYWAYKNGRFYLRENHAAACINYATSPVMLSCMIIKEDTKECFYASDYTASTLIAPLGPFINMKKQVKKISPDFSVASLKDELTGYIEELDALYNPPKVVSATNAPKIKKVKKLKKSKKPVVSHTTSLSCGSYITPRPDIVLLYERLLKCKY
jgi:hypothetical protein